MVLLVRRMGWQLLINLLLTVGVFAARTVDRGMGLLLPAETPCARIEVHEALVWLGVMVITSPIYLASARNIQAMAC